MDNQLIKRKPINKIVVVGHPLSGYQELETLLKTCGMNPPQPSRRDGFLPSEINATLCKAHRIPPFNALHLVAEIEQIDAGPIWSGMALDLMLGNIDQELWGWADPQSVYLLDYWKALDPQLFFVLVYNTPEQLVAQAFNEQTPLSPESLQQASRNWIAYNSALLHFYHRNPERCLLVHAQQVRASASTYLQQVRTRIGTPVFTDRSDTYTIGEVNDNPARQTVAPQQDALKEYIAHALIKQQHDAIQLYEKLQSVANLPLIERATDPNTPFDAWLSMVAVQTHYTEQLTQAQSESLTLSERLEQTQTITQQRIQEQQQESELLLLQLHQVQEELDHLYLEGQQQKEKIQTLQKIEKLANERANQIEQINKAAKNSPVDNTGLKQENELLLLQLHQVQEELEHYFLENQQLKKNPVARANPTKHPLYGAADRIKRQLSYRLGATMIAQSRSFMGLLAMPWALYKQVLDFKREKKTRGDILLPPIKDYYDAHEAERVKQHLSYRLGSAMIANVRHPLGWLKLPWALRREILNFKLNRGK